MRDDAAASADKQTGPASETVAASNGAAQVSRRPWLTPGVGGIGTASFFADVGHEVPTALLPSFVTTTLENALLRALKDRSTLEQSKALLAIAGRTARLGGWLADLRQGQIICSDEVCELHQVAPGHVATVHEALNFYTPDCRYQIGHAFERCAREGLPYDLEASIQTAQGQTLWVRVIGNAVRDSNGAIYQLHGSVQDITPEKMAEQKHAHLEEQFRQAQKMETIGNLAGGIAHDFNNLISVILGFANLAKEDLPASDARFADLSEVEKAAQRASELTRQLLAFSRKQMLSPRVLDLNPVLSSLERMLARLLGEDVHLSFLPGDELDRVHADPGQLEQVIVNLAVNARDAMPRGGNLTIETSNVELDDDYAWNHPEVTAGCYVLLAVRDSGEGMDRATQARIFEPFFTTKEQGKGTGLGLATVYGIVRQSGGHIEVQSEPGQGTTFKIYLPRTDRAPQTAVAHTRRAQDLRGTETVLLVEDEDQVRALVRSVLHKNGYNVLEAQNGGEAFLLCEKYQEKIELLLTDLVMPRMNGRELADRLAPLRPHMKVLYMSGYNEEEMPDTDSAFLSKPLSPDSLLSKVRHTLAS
ncbi:hypothetical protein ABS71_17445 [bacterium SCN 62-11]|nr:MAG: hypothetical protein ABS71_17445 [bacterium SCN 62-11]